MPVEIGLTPVATEQGMFVLSSVVDITARQRKEAGVGGAVSKPVTLNELGRQIHALLNL